MDYKLLAEQIDGQEFDHVFVLHDNGTITDARNMWAPTVTHSDEHDIDIEGEGWQAIVGLTGQYGYNGAVMHASEYVGVPVARLMHEMTADEPIVFALVVVTDPHAEEGTDDAVGWAIMYRPWKLDTSDLTDGGDRLELPDGRFLKLTISHDPDWSINDYEAHGRVSYPQGHHNDRQNRPADFDGAARKVWYDRSSWCWWQPPDDVKSDPEAMRDMYSHVRDLMEFGFHVVTLELGETVSDSRGGEHEVIIAGASLGGVDDVSKNYLPLVVDDLVSELDI